MAAASSSLRQAHPSGTGSGTGKGKGTATTTSKPTPTNTATSSPAPSIRRRQRATPSASTSTSAAASPRSTRPSTPAPTSNISSTVQLPPEVYDDILHLAALATVRGKDKVVFLLLSSHHRRTLAASVYATIVLDCSRSLSLFADLVRRDGTVARSVRRVWISPLSCSSDLVTALTPPSPLDAGYVTALREGVHSSTRTILRACRRLDDVALSGELLSTAVAGSYGSACQPRKLTSVNPHSFVGGFSAQIFRRVRQLRIVDTSLADEEVEQLRRLGDLEQLTWQCPKDYGDVKRDSEVLCRLLSLRAPPGGRLEDNRNATDGITDGELETVLSSLSLSPSTSLGGGGGPNLTLLTASTRCATLSHLLAPSSRLSYGILSNRQVADWDTLRDVINQASEGFGISFPTAPSGLGKGLEESEGDGDGGPDPDRALRQILVQWFDDW